MAENIPISVTLPKQEKYEALVPVLKSLLEGETSLIANLANTSAVLKEVFNWLWVGFYLVEANELVLGPFQGPAACTRLAYGKGVCGKAWEKQEILCVPDVDQFPGHIACSSASRSELVIPLIKDKKVWAILDIDSEKTDHFDAIDIKGLEAIAQILNDLHSSHS